MIDEIEYFKIMKYTNTSARVYYVTENRSAGILITFRKQGNEWVLDYWEAIWSKTGSAEGNIWPYYK